MWVDDVQQVLAAWNERIITDDEVATWCAEDIACERMVKHLPPRDGAHRTDPDAALAARLPLVAAFDREALPRTAAYVASLPGGLDAYPTSRVRTAVTREITDQFPNLLDHPGIEREHQLRLRQSLDQGEWMSEAEGTVVRLLVRDIEFATDAEYHRWYFDVARRLFAKPFYRALMYVVSPTLVMLGASKRWAAFREGSTLTARVDRKEGTATLLFPEGLYPELTLIGFGEAFRASLMAAGARNLRVELVEATPVRASWALAWQ